jgi:hypothetical protein
MSGRITDSELVKLRNHGPALLALADRHVKGKLKKRGDEWNGCCPFHEDKHPSFSVNAKDGLYRCLGCDAKGDTIAFAMKAEGLTFIKACELVAQTAGIPLDKDKKTSNGNGTNGHSHTQAADWTPLAPTHDTPRPTATDLRHYQLGQPTDVYEYVGRDGSQSFYVRRFDRVGQKKELRPLSYGVLKQRKGWHDKAYPAPRPLFRLDAVAQAGDQTILLVEGEKAVKAAEQLYPDCVITTWSGGSKAVAYSDFTPLGDGANVILWPDADEQGIEAMKEIASLLPKARWLDVSDLSDGFDAADLEDDDPQAWFDARIQELPEVTPPPHELPPIYWEDQRVSDWAGRIVPDMEWIVPGWIPAEQLTGLYGVGGINKTDFLIQLLMARSRGLIFLGFQLEASPVYGLFCEDTREQIIRRIDRIALHYGLTRADFPDLHFVSLVGYDQPELMIFDQDRKDPVTDALRHIDKMVLQTGARLVTLDMGDHFFGGDPLRNRDIIRFVRKLDGVSVTRRFGMLMSRHPSQRGRGAGGRMESGSVGWEGCMRARIGLDIDRTDDQDDNPYRPKPVGEGRTLILWKSNYSQAGITIDLVCKGGVFTTNALDPEKAQTRGPGRNVACEDKFLELLRAVIAQGAYVHDSTNAPSRYAPAVFASRPEGKAFSKSEYVRAMHRLLGKNQLRYETKRGVMRLAENTTNDSQNTTPDPPTCV